MRSNKRFLLFCAIVASAAITTVPRLVAQEMDLTAERDSGPDVEDNEELANPDDELHKPANTWPKGGYVIIVPGGAKGHHLGPTGLWGVPMGQNLRVKEVDRNSPADGKVFPDDIIYAANGKGFAADRDARYSLSLAITEAETKEAGGKLILDIRRDENLIQVPIQLEVMGSFSATTPWNCEKSEKIVARAEEYMRKGLRPETGLPNNNQYMYAPWNDSVLFLLASGNPEMQGLVRRYIRNTIDDVEDYKAWVQVRGGRFNPYNGWGTAFLKLLFGEYYHRTGDRSVLPYLEPGAFNRGPNPHKSDVTPSPEPKMNWSWPPAQPTGYGTHAHAQLASTMGDVLAKEAGLAINEDKLLFDLKYLYVKRAEFGYVGYHGYGAQPIENRQVDQPEEITPEHKEYGSFSAMNGKPGMAAAFFSMVEGYEKAVEMCSERSVYAFNRTQKGHGGIWFNGFWTPIGASHAGPEKFQLFMKGQQWYRELYRDHTGAMWQVGNAREKEDTLGTGYAIHRVIPRKNLRMLGAPRSMFGPTAPSYMKEALAAHRNRDYALAEQLTRALQAGGTVPAEDKDRVSHFLNSVKTLKESIEHDLTFTEGLLAKRNYVLASIELSQLQLVASPDNPRLNAIAMMVESKRDQIPTREEMAAERLAAGMKAQSTRKEGYRDEYETELASILTLVKDSAEHLAPKGVRKGTLYPLFEKAEASQWRMLQMPPTDAAPAGWEQPDFDDSKWKAVTLPSGWRENHAAFLRASFEVQDVNAFEVLRVRGLSRSQSNLTMYLNGEVVAKGAEIPGSMTIDLKPSALGLLRKGKNTLAISSHRSFGKHPFSIRLDGIQSAPPPQVADNSPKRKADTEKNSKKDKDDGAKKDKDADAKKDAGKKDAPRKK